MDSVGKLSGCPKFLRGDFGTEHCVVKELQQVLWRDHDGNNTPYLEGASTHNQRIESWWGQLRKQCMEYWITLFQTLRNDGLFDGSFLDKNILQFCSMEKIQVI